MARIVCLILALALVAHGCASWGTWSVNGVEVVGPDIQGWAAAEEARKKKQRRTAWAIIGGIAAGAALGGVIYAVSVSQRHVPGY